MHCAALPLRTGNDPPGHARRAGRDAAAGHERVCARNLGRVPGIFRGAAAASGDGGRRALHVRAVSRHERKRLHRAAPPGIAAGLLRTAASACADAGGAGRFDAARLPRNLARPANSAYRSCHRARGRAGRRRPHEPWHLLRLPARRVGQGGHAPGAQLTEIGHRVASLVRDGDTLQLGIGKMQSAVVRALRSHRRLRLHSGMVTEEIVNLLDVGAIRGPGSVVAGVALGDDAFYRRLSEDASFTFRSVDETHDVDRIAGIPGFVAVNAALEVDLFGQVNSDCLDGQLQADVGGMPPFVAGARRSPGGRAIFCLNATAARGTASRIVPKLGAGSAVGVPRHAVDAIVTEYGVAELAPLPVHRRAERLIELAAPSFRADLAREWATLMARL